MKRNLLLLSPIVLVAIVSLLSRVQRAASSEPAQRPAPAMEAQQPAPAAQARRPVPPVPGRGQPAIEVFFSPGGGCTDAIVREVARARQMIRIQAYSLTSTPIARALVEAQKRGVRVEVVLDKSSRAERRSSATSLWDQGCHVWIDARHAAARSNILLIDDRTIITGSFSFTPAAEESNAEDLLVIRDSRLMERYQASFKEHQAHAEPFVLPSAPPRGTPATRKPAGAAK